MADYDESEKTFAATKTQIPTVKTGGKKTISDYFALAIATFGVGYLPLAPGTWGSAIGILIYLSVAGIVGKAAAFFILNGWNAAQVTAWIYAVNLLLFLFLCLLSVWSASRAAAIFGKKDPQKVVADEVVGQLLVFLFVPLDISWKLILAGFLLFRLFDIWKPYPIGSLEDLPTGIGICADDILAGVYGGICLAIIYAVSLTV